MENMGVCESGESGGTDLHVEQSDTADWLTISDMMRSQHSSCLT